MTKVVRCPNMITQYGRLKSQVNPSVSVTVLRGSPPVPESQCLSHGPPSSRTFPPFEASPTRKGSRASSRPQLVSSGGDVDTG